MRRFYQVAGLKPEIEVIEEAHAFRVDLTEALHRPFSYNDDDILKTQRNGEYIWASGGGTWLLNQRYILVVQRSLDAKVNPGKFSLFTGRADNTHELLSPNLLARELFEELVLFTENRIYRPFSVEYNIIIDAVYCRLEEDLGLDMAASQQLLLHHLLCSPKNITVMNQGSLWEGSLDCHVNSNREINILFVFVGYLDIDKLQAMDGEYYIADGKIIRNNRSVYLYDLQTDMVRDITIDSRAGIPKCISRDSMTEHLQHVVESVRRKVAKGILESRTLSN
jgi:hypothetical protein